MHYLEVLFTDLCELGYQPLVLPVLALMQLIAHHVVEHTQLTKLIHLRSDHGQVLGYSEGLIEINSLTSLHCLKGCGAMSGYWTLEWHFLSREGSRRSLAD